MLQISYENMRFTHSTVVTCLIWSATVHTETRFTLILSQNGSVDVKNSTGGRPGMPVVRRLQAPSLPTQGGLYPDRGRTPAWPAVCTRTKARSSGQIPAFVPP